MRVSALFELLIVITIIVIFLAMLAPQANTPESGWTLSMTIPWARAGTTTLPRAPCGSSSAITTEPRPGKERQGADGHEFLEYGR